VVLNLGTARGMLPLVGLIAADVMHHQQQVMRFSLELENLDNQRRTLDWPRRQRRYRVQDELANAQKALQDATSELDSLGVVLVDAQEGRVGLPTVVNGRLAFFSWKPADANLQYWHFPNETVRRVIPASWKESGEVQLRGKS
jgi:hypothetical protein